jgi:hypothetical protein
MERRKHGRRHLGGPFEVTFMSSDIRKWQEDEKALALERQRMNEALARLGQVEARVSYETETRGGARRCGLLVFILDLTGSRKASLRQARIATAEMFTAVKRIGAVAVKLIYYRGDDECKASDWQDDPEIISRAMRKLSCETGATQIARALRRVLEGEREPVAGVVFIGDHNEDNPEELVRLAAALGEKGVPVFVFHECADDDERAREARPVFMGMAAASNGAYCEFEPDSSAQLGELLSTVAAFSAAGIEGVKQVGLAATPQARELQSRLLLGPGGGK